MFSEDLKRGVCLDDLDFGLDWNALIKKYREIKSITSFMHILEYDIIAPNKKNKLTIICLQTIDVYCFSVLLALK